MIEAYFEPLKKLFRPFHIYGHIRLAKECIMQLRDSFVESSCLKMTHGSNLPR